MLLLPTSTSNARRRTSTPNSGLLLGEDYPFGSLSSGSIILTDKKFTGQQEEGTAFGLYDYGARFYSTLLGRFISADRLSPRVGNPQTWDRYAYAVDNPLLYTDPTGLCVPGVNCPDDLAEDLDTSISSNVPYGPAASDPLYAPASPPTPAPYNATVVDTNSWQVMHDLVDLGFSAGQIKDILTISPADPQPEYSSAPALAPSGPDLDPGGTRRLCRRIRPWVRGHDAASSSSGRSQCRVNRP